MRGHSGSPAVQYRIPGCQEYLPDREQPELLEDGGHGDANLCGDLEDQLGVEAVLDSIQPRTPYTMYRMARGMPAYNMRRVREYNMTRISSAHVGLPCSAAVVGCLRKRRLCKGSSDGMGSARV